MHHLRGRYLRESGSGAEVTDRVIVGGWYENKKRDSVMKRILIIGGGISGLACAIQCARDGCQVVLASPFPSEQAKSVLVTRAWSAGRNDVVEGDGVTCHVEDTMRTGYHIASLRAVEGMCRCAPLIVRWLDSLGTTLGGSGQKRTVCTERD